MEERPRRPKRLAPLVLVVETAERIDLVESLRNRKPEPGEARFIEVAARATCDAEGMGGVWVPGSPWFRRRAVKGGLPVGEW